MKVSLIDYTGACAPDPARYAANILIYTKNTRLQQNAATQAEIATWDAERVARELDYISKTIRSSWEFIEYNFQVQEVSRSFTHQFVRTRTMSFAQQSQRSVDLSAFEYVTPKKLDDDQRKVFSGVMERIAFSYRSLIAMDVSTEDARAVLPNAASTNIIAKANLRTLADLAGKRDNPRAQGEYTEVFQAMAAAALAVHPWIKSFLYPERLSTPALDALLREALGKATPVSKPAINDALKELDALKEVWG